MKSITQKLKLTSVLAYAIAVTLPNAANAYDPAGTPDDWPAPMERHYYGNFLIDRLEAAWGDNEDGYVWDATGWYGGDVNRLWLKTEGEGARGKAPESSEVQLLYGRLIAPFWDFQAGIRYDFRPNPNSRKAVIGIQGVVPYEFELDAALFVSDEGDTTVRVEFEYELMLTQRLIFQPRFEFNGSFSENEAIGLHRGVNNTELGLRLRYEIRREFAPYIGIEWAQKYAATANAARRDGEPTNNTAIVAGIRMWF